MTQTNTTAQIGRDHETASEERGVRSVLFGIARRPFVRESLIVLVFCLLTAIVTWPYVTSLRDAVVDTGDPYFVAWTLWWDYHATFSDPLNLFHANIFYPLRYTLAFSEHCYGIALLCFPLFALGLKPLTVHAIAMFFGFALCGYGAFRLARTLTGSSGVAWVAGIVFAFIPYRFQLMLQLPYLFSVWVPLLFEALVLFARASTWKRAAWVAFTFLMTGLTTVTWFLFSLVPMALIIVIVLARYQLWRKREFWRRGAIALVAASLLLLPFMLPYYIVSNTYGFQRNFLEVKGNSAWPIHWLVTGAQNKLWGQIGINLAPLGAHRLFPGLLPILLSLAALFPLTIPRRSARVGEHLPGKKRFLRGLDALTIVLLFISLLAVALDRTNAFGGLFYYVNSDHVLGLLLVVFVARISIAYPAFLRWGESTNLIETLRSPRHATAYWLGVAFTLIGFCYSLGWNFFFYRLLFDMLPFFKSIREPRRGSMLAYLGLALLAGLGTQRVAQFVAERRPRVRPAAIYACVSALLLFEVNAAPLHFVHGEVFPDAVTLRLKDTPMRGGIVVLPIGPGLDSRPTLRAADHAKPLIVGMSGFKSPFEIELEQLTGTGPITTKLLDLLEQVPASYLVVETNLIPPEQRTVYETFLARAVAWGRLRFINRFDGRDDLYAVVKTEPDVRSEAALPFAIPKHEWAATIADDPINLIGLYQTWSQKLFRLHVASFGKLPRYADFVRDAHEVGRGVVPGFEEDDKYLERNFREFVDGWTRRATFREVYDRLSDAEYLSRLFANAGLDPGKEERAALAEDLFSGRETRAAMLLRIVEDRRFEDLQEKQSLVALHFFGYLRRNPDDPPDQNLDGMLYWIHDLECNGDRAKITRAFRTSIEREALVRQSKR